MAGVSKAVRNQDLSSRECEKVVIKNFDFYMKQRGYTKSGLCKELNLDPRKFGKMLKGELDVKLSLIKHIADLFEVPIDDLIGSEKRSHEYRKELQNLIFAMNASFNEIRENLEINGKVLFTQDRFKVAIVDRGDDIPPM